MAAKKRKKATKKVVLTDFGKQSRELEDLVQAVRDMPQETAQDQCKRWNRLAAYLPSLSERAPDGQFMLWVPDHCASFPNSPQLRDPAHDLCKLLYSITEQLIDIAHEAFDRRALVTLTSRLDDAMGEMPRWDIKTIAINQVLLEADFAVDRISAQRSRIV